MKYRIHNNSGSLNRGYTLLFAVITASLVLAVAVFILSVSKKQYALAVAARDSLYSLYAADSGMECAVASSGLSATGTPLVLSCNGIPANATPFAAITNAQSAPQTVGMGFVGTVYQTGLIKFNLIDSSCVNILVTDGYDTNGSHKTIVDSRGYNFCDSSANPQVSTRTVERALRLTFR